MIKRKSQITYLLHMLNRCWETSIILNWQNNGKSVSMLQYIKNNLMLRGIKLQTNNKLIVIITKIISQ